MRRSQLFCRTLKEDPRDAESVSHKLLSRAGFIDQLTAGVFTFLPLGFKVLKKIESIIRKNMEAEPLCGQELLLPSLNPKENWEKTGRWSSLDILFKLKGSGNKDYVLAPTHEEIISPLAKKIVFSYRDLPFYLFQIQNKFRNELRIKSGLLRTREFMMKDLYSFHASEKDLDSYYKKVGDVYLKIFKECGIRKDGVEKITYQTLASGGTFSKYSHEYQTITPYGEDTIYICSKCSTAINKELKSSFFQNKTGNSVKENKNLICPSCRKKSDFREEKSVEVGNIFKLGSKFSLPFNLNFRDKKGKERPVLMGCYGLGLSRLLGAIVEVNNDKRGIIWPEAVAPFKIYLIPAETTKKIIDVAERIYSSLQKKNIEILYDDRKEKTVGEKFAEADLLGIPYRIVVSRSTLRKKSVEIKKRDSQKVRLVKLTNIEKFF